MVEEEEVEEEEKELVVGGEGGREEKIGKGEGGAFLVPMNVESISVKGNDSFVFCEGARLFC